MPKEKEKKQPQEQTLPPVTRGWGQQITGALIGAMGMAIVLQIGTSLGWTPGNRSALLLMGGAIGATLFDLDRFAQAGSRLTRRTEGRGVYWLNVLLALLGMALVIGFIFALASSVGWLLERLF